MKTHTHTRNSQAHDKYAEAMSHSGFRFTRQRREVYDAIVKKQDHPTATGVFMRVKERMPTISLATVYNCLELLTEAELIRQVNIDRGPSRFCPNLEEHGHFFCEQCGIILDVSICEDHSIEGCLHIPKGSIVTYHKLSLYGLCPDCASEISTSKTTKAKKSTKNSKPKK